VPRIFRVVCAGLAAALIVAVTGYGLERARFGPSDQSALTRVEAELRQRFDASAATLGAIATRLAAEPDTARAAPRDQASLKRLFDLVTAAMPDEETGRTGITIYDSGGSPLAWAGRVSDLGKDVVLGSAPLIVAPGPPGLIRIEPVTRAGIRAATVVVEQALGTARRALARRSRWRRRSRRSRFAYGPGGPRLRRSRSASRCPLATAGSCSRRTWRRPNWRPRARAGAR
jgi:hypothetical protein